VAVVIPCFRVAKSILDVIAGIGTEATRIYVVDDCCPEQTGDLVSAHCRDPRVVVIRNPRQVGVGGATIAGYQQALADGTRVIVKIDGDGQMDASLIPRFVRPILAGEADYTKGNRFYRLGDVRAMPRARLLGNAALSFLTKFSTGYWDLFDPTNGFTAIHAAVLRELPLEKVSRGYFFESDLLFRLGTMRAAVLEVPMPARYSDEESNLRITRVAHRFLIGHLKNFAKRIFYNYYLRSFSLASVELVLGVVFLAFGIWVGASAWIAGAMSGRVATSGTVMLAGLPVIVGVQLLLAFLGHDVENQPRAALHPRLGSEADEEGSAASDPTDPSSPR
jgi:glycosyltransferase involved in cell wall biosynthesis